MDNFYVMEDKFFIVIDCQAVEVCELIYNEYKKGKYKIDYSDKKYNHWNASLDNDMLISAKYEYIASKHTNSLEENFLSQETIMEVFEKLSPIDRVIIKRLISGRTQTEIANEIGVCQQTVNKHKRKISQML